MGKVMRHTNQNVKKRPACSELRWAYCNHKATYFASYLTGGDRKSGSAGMPRPISYAVFCLKKKKKNASTNTLHRGTKLQDAPQSQAWAVALLYSHDRAR